MATVCAPITFPNVPFLKFRAILARIRAQAEATEEHDGVGTASGAGYTFRWNYTAPDQTLLIQCTRKPRYRTESGVENKIRSLVESVQI